MSSNELMIPWTPDVIAALAGVKREKDRKVIAAALDTAAELLAATNFELRQLLRENAALRTQTQRGA
jgi:hypothetical protein